MVMDSHLESIASLLERGGVGWAIRSDRESRLTQIAQDIVEVSSVLGARLGRQNFALLAEMQREAAPLKPLIQLFVSPTSAEMRAMVYCVLRGMDIKAIDFSYRKKSSLTLDIVLSDSTTGRELTFSSDNTWDAEILRHIGIMTASAKPVLHGFYAFH
jgi:hypothetical protein